MLTDLGNILVKTGQASPLTKKNSVVTNFNW